MVLEDPEVGNKPKAPVREALEDLDRVMKSTVATVTTKLYHSVAKGKNNEYELFQVLKHDSLRKLHMYNYIFI